ncbi:MAG: exodeoxyribonuclease III [Cyclobacteriaceae bacterium]
MKVVSYNINGIRAAVKKGLIDWLKAVDADVVCFQELKATEDVIDVGAFKELGYHCYWYSAEKKGYSGVGLLSKIEAKHVEYGCGISTYDSEGRVIRADFEGVSVVSAYFPSGSSGDIRQEVKMSFLTDMQVYFSELKKTIPNLLIAGDYNICHKAIDIHDPIRNKKSSGFLPEEREWMSRFFESGFIDTFRYFNKGGDQYSWWSYRANARNNNKGWRIDYISATNSLEDKLVRSAILPEAKHSDHCPILVELSV